MPLLRLDSTGMPCRMRGQQFVGTRHDEAGSSYVARRVV
jgi:hypothetical protein